MQAAVKCVSTPSNQMISLEKFKTLAHEVRVRRVLGIIETQPALSVRDLAREVELSTEHLQRLFKQQIGIRLSELVAELRLQHAAALLTTAAIPIKQIAHQAGYEHQSSFVRAFQRRFGCAPSLYRRESVAKS